MGFFSSSKDDSGSGQELTRAERRDAEERGLSMAEWTRDEYQAALREQQSRDRW